MYLEFANLDGTENACLKFAHQYGALSDLRCRLQDPGTLDTLRAWRGNIQSIRDIIKVCELGRTRPAEAFRRFGKRDRLLYGGLEACLSIESPKSPPTLKIRCGYFLAGIELQAVQSILGGRTTVQCIECSRRFEIVAGARRSTVHVPSQELPRVLLEPHASLKPGGVLFSSNPHGHNEEGWNGGRYGVYHDLDTWRSYVSAAGFVEINHYYRPAGLPRERQPWLASVWRRSDHSF